MSAYRRWFVSGGTYFFTVTLADRRATLLTDRIDDLRAAWRYASRRHPFRTTAYVVLPDHLHCIWVLPDGDRDFPTRWRLLKSHFSRAMVKAGLAGLGRRAGERDVWQRRYWEHLVRDDADWNNHLRYIHDNPVRHGLAGSRDEWPHSSWPRWKSVLPPYAGETIGDFGE